MDVDCCQSSISRQFGIMGPEVLLSSSRTLKGLAEIKGHYLLVRLSELRKQQEGKGLICHAQPVSHGTITTS